MDAMTINATPGELVRERLRRYRRGHGLELGNALIGASAMQYGDGDVQSPPLPRDHPADQAGSLSQPGVHKQLDRGCQPPIHRAEQSCQT
jgi:hypothetical protein